MKYVRNGLACAAAALSVLACGAPASEATDSAQDAVNIGIIPFQICAQSTADLPERIWDGSSRLWAFGPLSNGVATFLPTETKVVAVDLDMHWLGYVAVAVVDAEADQVVSFVWVSADQLGTFHAINIDAHLLRTAGPIGVPCPPDLNPGGSRIIATNALARPTISCVNADTLKKATELYANRFCGTSQF